MNILLTTLILATVALVVTSIEDSLTTPTTIEEDSCIALGIQNDTHMIKNGDFYYNGANINDLPSYRKRRTADLVYECRNGTGVVIACRFVEYSHVVPIGETLSDNSGTRICTKIGMVDLNTTTDSHTLAIIKSTTTEPKKSPCYRRGAHKIFSDELPNYLRIVYCDNFNRTEKLVVEKCEIKPYLEILPGPIVLLNETITVANETFLCSANGLTKITHLTTSTTTLPITTSTTKVDGSCIGNHGYITENGLPYYDGANRNDLPSHIPWLGANLMYECRNGTGVLLNCRGYDQKYLVPLGETLTHDKGTSLCTKIGLINLNTTTDTATLFIIESTKTSPNNVSCFDGQAFTYRSDALPNSLRNVICKRINGTETTVVRTCTISLGPTVQPNETITEKNETYLCTADGLIRITDLITTISPTTLPTTTLMPTMQPDPEDGSCIDSTGHRTSNGYLWMQGYAIENWPYHLEHQNALIAHQCINGTIVVKNCIGLHGETLRPEETTTKFNKTYLCSAKDGLKDITNLVTTTSATTLPTTASPTTLPTTTETTTGQPTTASPTTLPTTTETTTGQPTTASPTTLPTITETTTGQPTTASPTTLPTTTETTTGQPLIEDECVDE